MKVNKKKQIEIDNFSPTVLEPFFCHCKTIILNISASFYSLCFFFFKNRLKIKKKKMFSSKTSFFRCLLSDFISQKNCLFSRHFPLLIIFSKNLCFFAVFSLICFSPNIVFFLAFFIFSSKKLLFSRYFPSPNCVLFCSFLPFREKTTMFQIKK